MLQLYSHNEEQDSSSFWPSDSFRFSDSCYQCKHSQKCLKKCRVEGTIRDEFINAFHKYYKDGSKGTWDCRWFAGFFILLKCFAYVLYALSINLLSYVAIMLLCVIGAIIIVIAEPYKEKYYRVFNIISANSLLWLTLFYAAIINNFTTNIFQSGYNDHYVTVAVLSLFPLGYITGITLHHLMRRFRREKVVDTLSGSLPDRLLHSDQYRDSFGFIAAFPSNDPMHSR